jgi:hypothetical protein
MRLTRKLSTDERDIRTTYIRMGRKFDAFAWPGGYPIIYVCATGDVLCARCATKQMKTEWIREPRAGYLPVAYDVYYEGPILQCADCNEDIESAYGDPDDQTDDQTDGRG